MTALELIKIHDLSIWVEWQGDLRYALVLNSEFKSVHRTASVDGYGRAMVLAHEWIISNFT